MGGCLDNFLSRYANSGATTPTFTQHDISTSTNKPYWVELADIDADGDIGW